VNDVLAGPTGDVRTRSTDVFALDHRDTLTLAGKGPGSNGSSRTAAENEQIVFFQVGFPQGLG
jgi:hypothetical protein